MKTKVAIYGAKGRVGSKLISYDDRSFDVVAKIERGKYCIGDVWQEGDFTFEHLQEVMGKEKGIIVDATASKDIMRNFHHKIIESTPHTIVTANKNPLALGTIQDFLRLTRSGRRYWADTTVMAGAGIVQHIHDRYHVGDVVTGIQGMFSGTLGYIFSEFCDGDISFSQAVRDAYAGGYTEPHPYDDLCGLDVARKLLILARYSGKVIEMEDITLCPAVDESLYHEDVDTFLDNCKSLDEHFDELRKQAREQDGVLRYVASFDIDDRSRVELKIVDRHSPLGQLKGTHNIGICSSKAYQDPYPHIIQSRGAGLEVTAYSLLAQMLRCCYL